MVIKSQFSYCPLLWVFCWRRSNNLINNIYERAHRATFDDHTSNFTKLLEKKREFTIHQPNIQALMKEIQKSINNLSPPIIDRIFQFGEILITWSIFNSCQVLRKKEEAKMGLETISYRGPHLWNLAPSEFKKSATFWYLKTQ